MRLRVQVVADGVTTPDAYFDHPNFQGSNATITIYAETSPGVTDKFTPTGTATLGVFSVAKATGVFSPNDSHNPIRNSPSLT